MKISSPLKGMSEIAALLFLALSCLSPNAAFAVQIVTPNPIAVLAGPGDSASFDVAYSTDDKTLPGLVLQMHFDSSQFVFGDVNNISVAEVATNFLLTGFSGAQVQKDTANSDNDASTDSLLNVLWFDLTGNWPGAGDLQPITLFSSNLIMAPGFDQSSSINFSAEPASGQSFEATSVTITKTSAVPVPAAIWLFCSGLVGLVGLSRRKEMVRGMSV